MRRKIHYLICVTGMFLSGFLSPNLEACESDTFSKNRSFYAISSLRFYLDQIDSSNEQEIVFDQTEVDALWSKACGDSVLSPFVEEARDCYNQSTSPRDDSYLKAKEILVQVWEHLNYDLLESQTQKALPFPYNTYPNFDNNPYISKKMQLKMRPYLLPIDSSLKPTMDSLFSSSRVIENESSFALAGFHTLFAQENSFIRVAQHASLPGFLLKVYLDSEHRQKKGMPGWEWLTRRCEGAKNIRHLIKRKNLKYFTVPDKWLYPLPAPSTTEIAKDSIQPVVLVVTRMNLVSTEETLEAWLTKITPRHLDELYCILSHGYSSCFLMLNIPYTTEGVFACIDTEYPKRTMDFAKVKKYFSPEMQLYWEELIRKGGNI